MAPDRSPPAPLRAPRRNALYAHFWWGTLRAVEGRCAVEAWLIEALFVLVFVRTLVAYLARRDPLQRDVTPVFGAMAGRFIIGLGRVPGPSAPGSEEVR